MLHLRTHLLRQRYLHRGLGRFESTNDSFKFELGELNREVKSILGPLGDPDYEADDEIPLNANPVQHRSTTTPNVPLDPVYSSISRLHSPTGSLENGRGEQTVDDPFRKIVDAHCRELTSHLQQILDEHHIRLTSAIRTEVNLEKLRKSGPL